MPDPCFPHPGVRAPSGLRPGLRGAHGTWRGPCLALAGPPAWRTCEDADQCDSIRLHLTLKRRHWAALPNCQLSGCGESLAWSTTVPSKCEEGQPTGGSTLESEDLDVYLGNYSGPEFPLKVSITKNNNELVVTAEGQPEFVVKAFDTHKFRFEQAEIYFTFVLEEKKLIINQGGKDYNLFLQQ